MGDTEVMKIIDEKNWKINRCLLTLHCQAKRDIQYVKKRKTRAKGTH